MKIWRFRFLENLNENILSRLLALLDGDYQVVAPTSGYQPYAYIPTRTSRENNVRTSLCDGLNRLDIIGAVKDCRRRGYVWKLLQLLVKNHLATMSGDAQRQLFDNLEQLLNQVVKTQTRPLQMQKLLDSVKKSLFDNQYSHLGSQQLWASHAQSLARMQDTLNTLHMEREEDGVTLNDLPEDVLRLILDRLSDHSDIMRIGMTNKLLLPLVLDMPLWRRMCMYHFKNTQIENEIKRLNRRNSMKGADWTQVYKNLYRQFGMKDDYVDSIYLCNVCSCLFWKCLGHPCIVQSNHESSKMVTPQDFIGLFSV